MNIRRFVPIAAVGVAIVGLATAAVIKTRRVPVTAVCRLCGDHVCRWTSVLWQNQENSRGDVAVSHSSTIADLCSVCAGRVAEDVYTAVRAVIAEHRDGWCAS
jgi:hypothetical protein